MLVADAGFSNEVGRDFDALACLNCGVCTAVCELGGDLLARKLFRLVLLGAREKVLENAPTIYSCLLCRLCEANCPGGVPIADNVRLLRRYINRNVFHL